MHMHVLVGVGQDAGWDAGNGHARSRRDMQSTRTIQLVSSCLMGREYFDSLDPIPNDYFRILPAPYF